jgi:hypothetical protein
MSVSDVGFFVVGSPRAGTTLVQRLCCELPRVRMPPETHFFAQFVPGLLRRRSFPLAGDDLADEIGRFAALDSSRGLSLDVDAIVSDLGGRCERAFELFEAIVRCICGPAEMLGEKTPDHLMWWRPISCAAPATKFVAVVRDPRAVVASNLAVPWRDDPRVPSWDEDLYLAFAARWASLQRCLLSMQRELGPSRCLRLRYEDVVSDPDASRAAIATFLGLPVPDAPLQAPADIVLPWETWKREALEPVTTERTDAWRESLGPRRAALVAAVCRRPMRDLGYDGDVPSALRASAEIVALGPKAVGRLVRYARAYDGYLEEIERSRI